MLAFVINLERDCQRLERVMAEADRVGLRLQRFAAVDGLDLDPELSSQFFASGKIPHEPLLAAGEIGCYASHLRILQRLAADEHDDVALVLEDDVHLSDDFVATLEAAIRGAPDWNIIRLSNATKSVVVPVAELPNGRELVSYWTVPNSAAAYLINRDGAAKFLKAYSKRTLPIDEDFRRPWRSDLTTYGVLPPPVRSGLYRSTITRMGRPFGIPARKRFAHATPARDLIASWVYRLRAFGPIGFFRALFREQLVAAVGRVFGWPAARRFSRLAP